MRAMNLIRKIKTRNFLFVLNQTFRQPLSMSTRRNIWSITKMKLPVLIFLYFLSHHFVFWNLKRFFKNLKTYKFGKIDVIIGFLIPKKIWTKTLMRKVENVKCCQNNLCFVFENAFIFLHIKNVWFSNNTYFKN